MDTETGHCTDYAASNTNDCGTCAISTGGPCRPLLDAYLVNQTCVELDDCVFQCPVDDTACVNACYTMHPQGVADYEAILHCVICEACPIECNADMDPRCAM